MELIEDEPAKKSKRIPLKSKGKYAKAFQVVESEQMTPDGDPEDD